MSNKNSKTKGDIGVLVTTLEATKRNYTVSIPFGDNERYDLVLEQNGRFERIQCKYLTPESNGRIQLNLWTVQHNKDKNASTAYKRVKYTSTEIDKIAVINSKTHEVYMIPICEAGNKATMRFCVGNSERNDKRIRSIDQYKNW